MYHLLRALFILKYIVTVSMDYTCPSARRYEERIQVLMDDMKEVTDQLKEKLDK